MHTGNDVSIVIPTYNEAQSIVLLLTLVKDLAEVIIADDNSPDGTAVIARSLGVTTIVRTTNRGLSPAVRAGARATTSDYILVMDGDGQHRPEDAAAMLDMWHLCEIKPDLLIGSRWLPGSRVEGLSTSRKLVSKAFNSLANLTAQTKCSDPMTGFCIVRKELLLKTATPGFKWLYEILLNNQVVVAEWPITFARRTSGVSKADVREVLRLLRTPRWANG